MRTIATALAFEGTGPIGACDIDRPNSQSVSLRIFHNRRWTGEVLHPNTPGRDPVMTRIIWLRGMEVSNSHAYKRCIYIHGTNEEKLIGRPASFGCIRMRSRDVIALYDLAHIGMHVTVTQNKIDSYLPKKEEETSLWARVD